jgi:hypothetical protein
LRVEDETALVSAARKKNKTNLRTPIGKQSAFIEFKQEFIGKQLEDSIKDNRSELKT